MKNTPTDSNTTRKVARIFGATSTHWVGNGFLVQSLLSYDDAQRNCDPFLLLDYAAPHEFAPNFGQPRGVGQHPHKGFETVTIAYKGEVTHRDSSGGGGTINEGDVQWMTAGGGIVHEEFHSKAFSEVGGPFEMVQLWVNLPAKDKEASAAYQPLTRERIPVLPLPDNAGSVRLIAGDYEGMKGAASTFTPINVWDVRLETHAAVSLPLPSSHNLAMVILEGEVFFADGSKAKGGELVKFERDGNAVCLQTADQKARVLFLSGEPIGEPIVGYGPFVMNSQEGILRAFEEYEQGKFGKIN